MSRDHSTHALTQEEHRRVTAAEQDLDRILSIQPSPEFAAKVRTRIAAGTTSSAGGRSRWVPMAAAAAFVTVLAGAFMVTAVRPKPDTGAGREPPSAGAARL
ncbi:MAG: hypothetical protein ABI818_15795, partial [Acidobacteriota bacterium]